MQAANRNARIGEHDALPTIDAKIVIFSSREIQAGRDPRQLNQPDPVPNRRSLFPNERGYESPCLDVAPPCTAMKTSRRTVRRVRESSGHLEYFCDAEAIRVAHSTIARALASTGTVEESVSPFPACATMLRPCEGDVPPSVRPMRASQSPIRSTATPAKLHRTPQQRTDASPHSRQQRKYDA